MQLKDIGAFFFSFDLELEVSHVLEVVLAISHVPEVVLSTVYLYI